MKPSYKPNEFRTLRRILPLVAVALALAGSPRLWGQCSSQASNSQVASVTVSPGSVVGGSGTTLTATIIVAPTVTGPFPFAEFNIGISGVPSWITSWLYYGAVIIPVCNNSAQVTFQVGGLAHGEHSHAVRK